MYNDSAAALFTCSVIKTDDWLFLQLAVTIATAFQQTTKIGHISIYNFWEQLNIIISIGTQIFLGQNKTPSTSTSILYKIIQFTTEHIARNYVLVSFLNIDKM